MAFYPAIIGSNSNRSVVPRALRDITFPFLDDRFTSMPLTFSIWRQQRLQRLFQTLSAADQESVNAWCAEMGRPDMFALDLGPELIRDGLGTALA